MAGAELLLDVGEFSSGLLQQEPPRGEVLGSSSSRLLAVSSSGSVNAVLGYFARQHELKGRIQLSENGRELIVHNVVDRAA